MATYSSGDPIADDIGHGAMGLRDNLRPFDELVLQSASQKHVFVALRAGKMLSGWSNYSTDGTNSGSYVIAWTETWAGILRDVVSVRTSAPETLSRAESATACAATAGTFYFDPDVLDSGNRWGGGTWNTGRLWDQVPRLIIHPTSGTDPDSMSVQALCGFYYGSHNVVQPTLGPEKLTNGDLETWASGSDASSWTEGAVGAGGGSVAQDTGFDGVGSYAAKISGALNGAGGQGISQAGMTGVAAGIYRVSGWYKTDQSNPSGIEARIRVGFAANYLQSDGRNTTAGTSGFQLANTYGQRRRFSFDFVCPSATAALELLAFAWNSTGGVLTAVGVWFDGLSVKRIWRFERYQARLSQESLPAIEERRPDAFFAPMARGSGTLTIINDDAHFEAPLVGLDWAGASLDILAGGRFINGGNEVPFEDLLPVLSGKATEASVNDQAVSLSFENAANYLAALVPPNVYDVSSFPNVATVDQSRRRPLIFGSVTNVRPARVDKGTGTALGLPIYELYDASYMLSNYSGTVDLYSYVDEASAEAQDTTKRISLSALSVEGATARLALSIDPRVIVVEAGKNDSLDFSVAGTPYTGVMPAGLYTWGLSTGSNSLATVLRTTLNAAGAGAIFNLPTYSLATGGKATITASSAFAILTGTGSFPGNSFWPDLGFTTHADVVAATSQTSNQGMFVDCDSQIFVRIPVVEGYRDSGGTFTGSGTSLIQVTADVMHFLLRQIARVPAELVNASAFVAARSTCPEYIGAYLGVPSENAEELRTIVERIENGAGCDLVTVRGRFELHHRDSTTSADVIDIAERDYITFESKLNPHEDVFDLVRLAYARDCASGNWKTLQTTTAQVRLQYDREEQRTFFTYMNLDTLPSPASRLVELVTQATTLPRRFTVTVKGLLFGRPIGQQVRLTRAKGLDPTGALDHVLCRMIGKTDNLVTHETVADVIEVL